MTSSSPDQIRKQVQERYSGVARSTAEPCCGPADCCGAGATDELLATLPAAAIANARGCGNPLALAELRQGETVLDLGSGGGLDVLRAAQRVGGAGFVYGLDANPDMLELARRNAADAGAGNVRFLEGDLEDIPLPDRSVDVILSNCVINLTPDKRRALSEAFRVLRPGGRLAVTDIVVDPDLEGFPLTADEIRSRLDWASCSAGALTRGQLLAALNAAGFDSVELQVLYRGSIGEPSPDEWEPLSPEQAQAVAERFTSMAIAARRP